MPNNTLAVILGEWPFKDANPNHGAAAAQRAIYIHLKNVVSAWVSINDSMILAGSNLYSSQSVTDVAWQIGSYLSCVCRAEAERPHTSAFHGDAELSVKSHPVGAPCD